MTKVIKASRKRRAKYLTKKFMNSRVSYKATAVYFLLAIIVGFALRYYFPIGG